MRRTLAALCLFVILTIVHTWPLARLSATDIVMDADTTTGRWALTELSQRLVRDPANLLDGNALYPFSKTLAVLDHNLASALLSAPLVVAGADNILIYNVAILATFVLSGLFTYLLVRRLTGSMAAGLVAGCAFAFSGFRAQHLSHSHVLVTQWLPLALLAAHAYFERPTWRRWTAFAAATLLLALSSWHIAIIGSVGLAVVLLVTMAGEPAELLRKTVGLLLVALLCGLALLPLAAEYARMGEQWPPRTGEGRETMGTLIGHSVNVVGLAAPGARSRVPYAGMIPQSEWSRWGVFPGVVVFVLVLPALAMLRGLRRDRATRTARMARWGLRGAALLVVMMLGAALLGTRGEPLAALLRPLAPFALFGLALAAAALVHSHRAGRSKPELVPIITYTAVASVGAILALGPRVFVGPLDAGSGLWRLDLLPIRLLIRAPERLALLLTLGAAVLAGFGMARLLARLPRRRGIILTVAVLAALNVDLSFRMPELHGPPPPSEVDRWLQQSPDEGAVIEYPLEGNYWATFASQEYGRRLVNGTGYLFPWEYRELEDLPDFSPEQMEHLWENFHPRFVVVRMALYPPAERARVHASIAALRGALRRRARSGQDTVYELTDRGRGPMLVRRWPRGAIGDRRSLSLEAVVTAGRADTVGELVVELNDRVLLEERGASVEVAAARLIRFGPEHLTPTMNTFVIRAAYRFTEDAETHAIGATGARLAADVRITSDRDRSTVVINGRLLPVDKGYFLAELDAATGSISRIGEFNVSWDRKESDALVAFVREIPAGSPVVVATEFDASRALTGEAVAALGQLGLAVDLRGQFQLLHAAVGVKGATPGTALEITDTQRAFLELGQQDRRRVRLRSLELR